tara:strand:+ start:483 stop:770 length:288 start_codon:yes stop_codon:yes gene_type:complete
MIPLKAIVFIQLIFWGLIHFLIIGVLVVAYFGLVTSLFFPQFPSLATPFYNILFTILDLGDEGLVGILVLFFYFVPYFLFKYFKDKHDNLSLEVD